MVRRLSALLARRGKQGGYVLELAALIVACITTILLYVAAPVPGETGLTNPYLPQLETIVSPKQPDEH